MRYCIRITFTDNEFIPLSNFHRFRFTHADTSRLARPRLASPSAITREISRRDSPPSIPSDLSSRTFARMPRRMQLQTDHRSATIGNAYATDRTHPHVKNTFSRAIGIRRPHARSSSHRSSADPLTPSLFRSRIHSAVQEKHHFIIQIRLVLNCLKPRTEFKLETARSSPHDRWLL